MMADGSARFMKSSINQQTWWGSGPETATRSCRQTATKGACAGGASYRRRETGQLSSGGMRSVLDDADTTSLGSAGHSGGTCGPGRGRIPLVRCHERSARAEVGPSRNRARPAWSGSPAAGVLDVAARGQGRRGRLLVGSLRGVGRATGCRPAGVPPRAGELPFRPPRRGARGASEPGARATAPGRAATRRVPVGERSERRRSPWPPRPRLSARGPIRRRKGPASRQPRLGGDPGSGTQGDQQP